MKFMLVDDERFALENLRDCVSEAEPDAELFCFSEANSILEFAKEKDCEVAFLDISIPGMTGIELAKELKKIQPKLNIIFVTGYSEYAGEAFSLRASGYVLKPVTADAVREELNNLRFPISPIYSGIYVHTFGNFEVFVGGEPVRFTRKPSKEILAYLVDRQGATATVPELAGVIFGDEPYDSSKQRQMQVFISEMIKTLKKHKAQDIISKTRNSLSVNLKAFRCDYYEYLEGSPEAINKYQGEYMSNYSWAEITHAWLDIKSMNF